MAIKTIRKIESVPTRCLTVNHASHVFLAGRGFIPTHNTFLVQTCLIPACGLVGFAPEPHNDDELRKLITSGLLAGRQSMVFDNLSDELASGTLASALTSRVWQDRVLGQSKEVSLPVRCVWASTGNWIMGASEIVDRFCPIKLEARGTPARFRPAAAFRHPDLHGWALENRARLVGAALTLINHWLEGTAEMAPDGTLVRVVGSGKHAADATLGSFDRWANVVGGVLAAADVRGFLANLEEARSEMDVEGEETNDFFTAWRRALGDRELTEAEVVTQCAIGGALHSFLPSAIETRDLTRSVRTWLRTHRGQSRGGLGLAAIGPKPLKWSVLRS